MTQWYILNKDHTTTAVNIHDYSIWNVNNDLRRVAKDEVGESNISTVFLGLDHSYEEGADPVLFETLVFDGAYDGEMVRYCTWEEAVDGHLKMVKKCGGVIKQKPEKDDSIKSRFDILDL